MRSVKRLAVVVATATAGLVIAGAGTANATGVTIGGVSANTCPQGYYGVVAGTTATGPAYVCENVF